MSAAPTEVALEVELPVCPTCHRVGKLPGVAAPSTVWRCKGTALEPHKVVKMELRLFREVPRD